MKACNQILPSASGQIARILLFYTFSSNERKYRNKRLILLLKLNLDMVQTLNYSVVQTVTFYRLKYHSAAGGGYGCGCGRDSIGCGVKEIVVAARHVSSEAVNSFGSKFF